jgi:hypothetical protein
LFHHLVALAKEFLIKKVVTVFLPTENTFPSSLSAKEYSLPAANEMNLSVGENAEEETIESEFPEFPVPNLPYFMILNFIKLLLHLRQHKVWNHF